MASFLSWVIKICTLASYILLLANIGETSVTWQRVTRPPTRSPTAVQFSAQQTNVIATSKPTTKAPVTWKRSTITRRSTDAAVNRTHAEELDDLHNASSEKDEEIEEIIQNSEVKPLVPGSRPGFWFDSARRKKPSSLLRPGTRRNSLFPTRSSTTEASTTVSVTEVPIIPRTPPEVSSFLTKNATTRLFGRNRLTKPPITFRRRVKTTPTPKKTTKTEIVNLEEDLTHDAIADLHNDTEKEEKLSLTEDVINTEEDFEDVKPIRPKFNIRRRRPYNGTRLSWTKKRIIRTTTASPQQFTTMSISAASTADYERSFRKTTKFPRTRINSRSNSTFFQNANRSKIKQTIRNNSKSKESTTASILEEINNSNDVNEENPSKNKIKGENLKEKTENVEEIYGTRQSSIDQHKSKARTTVEPFYITKEYGMVATAVPEITRTYDSKETTSTPIPSDEEEKVSQFGKVGNLIETVSAVSRKENKKTRNQVTETPQTTPSFEEKSQNIEKENDYNEDVEAPFEYIDDVSLKDTTTDSPTTTRIDKDYTGKKQINRVSSTTTTLRPLLLPVVPTVDPNSNAYVVWSVGHGGSGWSYEKQGGKVKWSAQNSEAEGDSWSVENKGQEDPNNQWSPVRTQAGGYKNGVKSEAISKEKLTPFLKDKGDIQLNVLVTRIPKLSLRNETILNFKRDEDLFNPTYEINNNTFTNLSYSSRITYANNATSPVNNLSQNSVQETQPPEFSLHTAPPFYPTIEDRFNAEVDSIINSYPSHYPYIAEIRETFKPPPTIPVNNPTTRSYGFQEYITQTVDESPGKEFTLPASVPQDGQFIQDHPSNIYPEAYPEVEIKPPNTYSDENSDKSININQYPITNLPYQSYKSIIPPELAKAVVKAKKWRVVGNGGNEGWSLLNEDGMLEWKIHNVDGHWRVTSAEELAKTQSQLQPTPEVHDNGRLQTGLYGYDDPYSGESPRVWTLDEDYAKWRAVSIERGIPTGKSSEESSESSEEYDYDSEDVSDNYHTNQDYDNFVPINPGVTLHRSNDNNNERHLWENGKNQLIQTRFQNLPISGNIEVANSKDDAVAAWKALIAQHGHWKISGETNERRDQYPSEKAQHIPTKNSDKRRIAVPENRENNKRDQERFLEAISEKYGRDSHHQGYKNEYRRSDNISEKIKHNTYDELPISLKQSNNAFRLKSDENYNYNNNEKADKEIADTDVYIENYDYQTESSEQKFDKHEDKQNSENYHAVANDDNYQKQKEDKFYDFEVKLLENPVKNKQQTHDKNQQLERLNTVKYKKDNVEEKQLPKHNYKHYHLHSLIKNSTHMNGKITEKNGEQKLQSDTRLKNIDQSKLESLIYKLEAIQKEVKGRAVIDITGLLNQMKARRNATNTELDHGKTNAEKYNQVARKYYNQENAATIESGDIFIKPKNIKSEPLQETVHLQKNIHYQSAIKTVNQSQSNGGRYNNVNMNKQPSIRSQNRELRDSVASNKSKRRKRPPQRLQNYKMHNLPSNQTVAFDGISNLAAKESEHDNDTSYYLSNKIMNDFPKAEKRHVSLSHASQLNPGKRRDDSSNSGEFIADLREIGKSKVRVPKRRKHPSRKRSPESHHPPPIVMKGETEVEDETGSKKSRKIIVIDYAGSPRKRKPVDKRDLELIIRNVKHRRSEMREDNTEN